MALEHQIAESEYEITWQETAWQAPNRAHDLRTYFSATGIRVIPRTEPAPSWEWALELARWGRAGLMREVEQARPVAAGNRMSYDRGSLVERYVNDARGLEQIFHIDAAPPTAEGASTRVHLDLELSGTLWPMIAEDGQAIDFATPDGARVLHYAALLVTDARGEVLPSWFEGFVEPGLRGIRIVYDDGDAVYPVTVDPLTTTTAWSAESNQSSAWFGYSVGTAGDVNGDGYSDVVVGAPLFDGGDGDEGRAFLYLGSSGGLVTTVAWTAESNQANALFGWSVAPAGDVDGDGFSDVIVGAYAFDDVEFDEGVAFVYHGSAAGLETTATWKVGSDESSANFGRSVGTAGDVNGDGYADVIVGAPNSSHGQSNEGRAFVYLGSAAGLQTTPAWTAESDDVSAFFGGSVASAGDVNGDGYADVIVGSSFGDNGQTNEGRAYVYHGSSAGLATTAAWTAESDVASALFGHAVASAGDVNGDGYADVVVGARDYTNGHSLEGRAYLYLGSTTGLATSAAWTVESNEAGARYGGAVGTAGDIDGDGYADVIVGAPGGATNTGQAFVYLGSAAGPPKIAAWSATSGQGSAGLNGMAAATAGDVNGDGYSDVVLGWSQYDAPEANEGRAVAYLGSAAGLAPTAGWTAEGNQEFGRFGHVVTTAGDVNGDGYSDVLVAADDFDNGEAEEGRAYLFLGSATGLAPEAAWTAEGDQASARFGISLSTAGDVNGDGYSDVVIGAYSFDNELPNEGRAFLYLGSPFGLAASPAWIAEGDQASEFFGNSVASAGDVNGDGYSDVLVGASSHNTAQGTTAGRAYLFFGSPTGLATSPAWIAEGDQASGVLGSSVATAGDVNRDGYSDVLIAAVRYDNGQTDEGRVYLYLGSAAGLAASPAWIAESNQADARFGHAIATAGDVNGDGYSDVLVAAHLYDIIATDEGRVFLYLGSAAGLGALPVWIAQNDDAGGEFGDSVASAGDVNGDGHSDVVIGAPRWDNGETNEGRAYLYLGSIAGLSLIPSWSVESNQALAFLGGAVASAGDVNGDGRADVLIGAAAFDMSGENSGRAFLYYGGGSPGLDRIPRQARTNGTTPIALLGKSDSESEIRLRARGRTPAGRGAVRLEWEIERLGTPLNGSGVEASALEVTGPPGASGSTTSFNEVVAGLVEGTFHHWRVRIASSNPYFPHSPWMSLAGNAVTETKLRTAGCVDGDGDGYGGIGDPSCVSLVADCDDSDPAAWATPGETENLRFTSKTMLAWDPPADPGGSLVYDTLRSGVASEFLLAECVESDDGTNTIAVDTDTPSASQVFFYLTRAQSGCPLGEGSLGTDSALQPRVGGACP